MWVCCVFVCDKAERNERGECLGLTCHSVEKGAKCVCVSVCVCVFGAGGGGA